MPTTARSRYRDNPSKSALIRRVRAMGLEWDFDDDDDRDPDRHPDWEAIAVALDELEMGHPKKAQVFLIKAGKSYRLTDVPDQEDNLWTFLDGDIDSVFEVDIDDVNLEEDQQIAWRELHPVSAHDKRKIRRHPQNYVYLSRLLGFGDYDNSSAVERSNHRVFMEEHGEKPGVYEIYGSHGSQAIALRLSLQDKDIEATLAALADYPLIDEEDMSRLEMEMQEEAYESWAGADFIREVEKELGVDITDDGDRAELFWRALRAVEERGRDQAFVEAGGGVVFPLEQMAKRVTLQDLDHIGATYEAQDDE
jgi:hypothetical protein